MRERIVVHYAEIGLKGGNRALFEKALVRNLGSALGPGSRVQRQPGRVLCSPAPGMPREEVCGRLARIPGVAHFAIATPAAPELEAITARALELLAPLAFETFAVVTRRSDKNLPWTSMEANARVGASVVEQLGKGVDLDHPDLRLRIEVTHQGAYLSTVRHRGPGGLPVGTSGTVVASLSGGIDSPVAAQLMMKRGCRVVFGHVRNENQYAGDVEGKIQALVRQLTATQLRSRLYVLPFGELQRQIIAFVPSRLRMIVYRRFMNRLLTRVARRERAGAIVTGDSVGQVASQTLENLTCIQETAGVPVLSPLIGMNKEEITGIARAIGTFDESIQPYPDCCSFLIAPHPETRADPELIHRCEAHLEDAEGLVDRCLEQARVEEFAFPVHD
jgi:thiamine biosynthesis protein ThiI